MKSLALLILALSASAANAACYADYKAKQDDPLRLHYGVMEVREDCSKSAAQSELAPRLAAAGWQLLNVVSVFDETQLDAKRGEAGEHFLRY